MTGGTWHRSENVAIGGVCPDPRWGKLAGRRGRDGSGADDRRWDHANSEMD
jgi:hypothetical protein